jgi:hypothetical protein
MLLAVVLAALLRVPFSSATGLTALAVLITAPIGGGLLARSIRRSGLLQVLSAAALAFAGLPVELAGGAELSSAVATALAWITILIGCALVVRAAFARAARGKERRARWLEAAAVALPAAGSTLFLLQKSNTEARATAAAAAGCAVLVLLRPTVKQMKQVGVALAGLVTVAAVALGT